MPPSPRPPVVARIGDLYERAEQRRTVPTDDPTIKAILGRLPGTRSSSLIALEFEASAWSSKLPEVQRIAAEFQDGTRQVRVDVERQLEPRRLVRSRASLGLYWFECYLPWIPEAGKADIAAVDTWGAVCELPDLLDLGHQAMLGTLPAPWTDSGLEIVESFVNVEEIASPRFYRGAHVVAVRLGKDQAVRDTFEDADLVLWGSGVARVVARSPEHGMAWLDVTALDPPEDSVAWARDFSAAHAIVASSVPIDQRHDKKPTKVRLVQSWFNLDGIVDSPTHYPNAWNIVLDASGDPPVKERLDAGEYRAVSFHANGYEVPTVYPAELVEVAVDPYSGRYDGTRDGHSR